MFSVDKKYILVIYSLHKEVGNMQITIVGLDNLCKDRITYELETEMWYDTLYVEGEMQNVVLNENVIFKCWTDEIMLDYGGEKVFFYRDDFKEIMIE